VKPTLLEALKHIALAGGARGPIPLTSADLGRALGVSQQAASQRVLALLQEGYVARDLGGRQARLRVTAKGLEALRREHAAYERLFNEEATLPVRGEVTTGLGEGAFYMRQEGYRAQFRRKLGFDAFAGTLNLRVSGRDLTALELLRTSPGIPIEEFRSGGRTFGGATCFPATLGGVPCAVILPLRTHHTDTVEVIAAENLRTRLGLRDGDAAVLQVRRDRAGMPAASL
jgi:riboflavin kinase